MGDGNSGNAFAGAGFAASAIGSIGSAYSQYKALKSQAAFAQAQAETNKKIADIGAADALARGEKDVKNYNKQVSSVVGAQKASFAGQGVDVGSGSAADIVSDTERVGAINAATIKANAFKEAWGIKAQGLGAYYQGSYNAMSYRNAAGNSLLTGGLQFLNAGLNAGAAISGYGKKAKEA